MNWLRKVLGRPPEAAQQQQVTQPSKSAQKTDAAQQKTAPPPPTREAEKPKKSIKQLEDERDVKTLLELVTTDHLAAQALGRLKEVGAVEPLIAQLNHQNISIRHNAMAALAAIGDVRAVEPLIDVVTADDMGNKIEATKALGNLQDSRATAVIVEQLSDSNGNLRQAAVEALHAIGDTQAVEPLIELLMALDYKESGLRSKVARALGALGDSRAVEPLIEALKDQLWPAADALLQIGAPSIEPLKKIEFAPDVPLGKRETVTKRVDELLNQLAPPQSEIELPDNQIVFGDAIGIALFPEGYEPKLERQIQYLKECSLANIIPSVEIVIMEAISSSNPDSRILLITGGKEEYETYLQMFYLPEAEAIFKRLFLSEDWELISPMKSLINVPRQGWTIPDLGPFNNKVAEIKDGKYRVIEFIHRR